MTIKAETAGNGREYGSGRSITGVGRRAQVVEFGSRVVRPFNNCDLLIRCLPIRAVSAFFPRDRGQTSPTLSCTKACSATLSA